MSNFVNTKTGELALGFPSSPFNDSEEIPESIVQDIHNYKYENGSWVYSPIPESVKEPSELDILNQRVSDLETLVLQLGGVI